MGVFRKIKQVFNRSPSEMGYKLVQQNGGTFFSWSGEYMHSDIIRSAIAPYWKSAGKMVVKHRYSPTNGEVRYNDRPALNLLLKEPNSFQSMQNFLEKMAIQLKLNNNSFAEIIRDSNGTPISLIPIEPASCKVVDGGSAIEFHMKNKGQQRTILYTDLIHLRQEVDHNNILGVPKTESLNALMDIVSTMDDGLMKAIKNSSVIRWLLKFNVATLTSDDLRKRAKEFSDNFLSTEADGSGVAATAGSADAIQVKTEDYVPNFKQMEATVTRIYNLFGVNEAIIKGTQTEDEWISYYESELESFAILLSQEMTRKLFTIRERMFGNEIVIESSNLQHASLATKLNLFQMVDRNAMLPNEWRAQLNLSPIEGGDKPLRRLDTAVVGKEE